VTFQLLLKPARTAAAEQRVPGQTRTRTAAGIPRRPRAAIVRRPTS